MLFNEDPAGLEKILLQDKEIGIIIGGADDFLEKVFGRDFEGLTKNYVEVIFGRALYKNIGKLSKRKIKKLVKQYIVYQKRNNNISNNNDIKIKNENNNIQEYTNKKDKIIHYIAYCLGKFKDIINIKKYVNKIGRKLNERKLLDYDYEAIAKELIEEYMTVRMSAISTIGKYFYENEKYKDSPNVHVAIERAIKKMDDILDQAAIYVIAKYK